MDRETLQLVFTGVATTVPTLTVLVAMLQNNSRFNSLETRIDTRLDDMYRYMGNRFDSMEKVFDAKIARLEEVMDARLKHLEEHR